MPFPIPGPFELILLLVIILVIFGPGKLPDIGNAVGKGIREFRKASSELEDSVRGETKRSDDAKAAEGSDRSH
jgi:TatA/E family protein of Tat protein translocase